MARYRSDYDDDRAYFAREERLRREGPGHSNYSYEDRRDFERPSYSERGRFGERADYDYDEPRYSESRERYRDNQRRSSLFDIRGDLAPRGDRAYAPQRSRLRCRDIMTRDLAVATRDTSLTQIARMMKQEDTGVIPVVEYDTEGGNGKAAVNAEERNNDTRNYSRGRLVGLITDRDIAIRAVAEAKDCGATRAEEVMSTSVHTVRPNDRVVDGISKMADKQVRRIPIVNEGGYLVGMISMADVATETHADAELAEALEEISKGTSFWNRIFG